MATPTSRRTSLLSSKENRHENLSRPSSRGTLDRPPTARLAASESQRVLEGKNMRDRKAIDDLETTMKQKSDELKRLRLQNTDKDKRLEDVKKRNDSLQQDYRAEVELRQSLEEQQALLRKRLFERDQENDQLNRRLEHVRSSADDRLKRSGTRDEQQQKRATSDEVYKLQEELHESQQESSRMQHRIEAAQGREKAFTERIASLEDTIRRLEVRSKEMSGSVSALSAEQKRSEELQEQVLRIEQNLHKKDLELDEQRRKGFEFEDVLERAEAKCTSLKVDLDHERLRRGDLEEKHFNSPIDLVEQLARAREEVEQQADELRRWQDYHDEQHLREVTLDMKHQEQIQRLKQDMDKQFQTSQADVLAENKALEAELRLKTTEEYNLEELSSHLAAKEQEAELREDRLSQLRSKLDKARKEYEELETSCLDERRRLEIKLSQAEGRADMAEEELTEEREKAQAISRALKVQYDTSTEAQLEEFELRRVTEQQRNQEEELRMEKKLRETRSRAANNSWRLLVEKSLCPQSATDELWEQIRKAAYQWRVFAKGHESDEAMLSRQVEELKEKEDELQTTHENHKQLLESFQVAHQEIEYYMAEANRLRAKEDAFEVDVGRMEDRTAQLSGHTNPKQKIQHLMDLKDEVRTLREQVKRKDQQVSQLNAKLRASTFFEALGEETVSRNRTPNRRQSATPATSRELARTPSRNGLASNARTPRSARDDELSHGSFAADSVRSVRSSLTAAFANDERLEAARREKAEAVRISKAHRRATERAVAEYQHLAGLVSLLLCSRAGGEAASHAVSSLSDFGSVTPERVNLLQKLRDSIAGPAATPLQGSPPMAAPTCSTVEINTPPRVA